MEKHRTLKEIREETALRKRAGTLGVYPPVDSAPKPKPLPLASAPFRLNEGDCKYLGKRAPGEKCGSGIYVCDHFGKPTARHVKCPRFSLHCPTCRAFVPKKVSSFAPLEGHFNASCFTWKGRNYLFSRKGWTGSNLYVTELGKDFECLEGVSFPRLLPLSHDSSRGGREDPRFFSSRGMPFVSFIGVQLVGGRTKTSQLYAQLDDEFRVVKVIDPELEGRKFQEKNWAFFEHGGKLHSVYSVSPHAVLRHEGKDSERAERVSEVDWFPPWTGKGHMRGGASPVLVGGEYWHFFHGVNWRHAGHKEYTCGLYTFDAKPPFAPRRGPVLVIDTPPDRPNWPASVAFPCGAVFRGDHWLVSYGRNDETYEIVKLDHAELNRRLTDTLNSRFNSGFSPATVTALPGWCSPEKALSAVELVNRGGIKTACEVGVYGGRWSVPVALALKRRNEGGKLYCVDAWDRSADTYSDPDYVKRWDADREKFKEARAAFFAEIERHDLWSTVVVIEKDSRRAAPEVPGGLDLLHIDGCHDRDTSCFDVVNYGAKVRPGGFVAFDDSHWDSVQDALSILGSTCGLERDYNNWRLYKKF